MDRSDVLPEHQNHTLVWSGKEKGPVCLDCGNVRAFAPRST